MPAQPLEVQVEAKNLADELSDPALRDKVVSCILEAAYKCPAFARILKLEARLAQEVKKSGRNVVVESDSDDHGEELAATDDSDLEAEKPLS